MNADHAINIGLMALDDGRQVKVRMRDGASFTGPLTHVHDDYVFVRGLGLPMSDIKGMEIV